MSKSTRVVLGLALALASGTLAFTGAANAQAQSGFGYVASGENAGGSIAERGARNLGPQAGKAFAYAGSAQVDNGAYTDPSPFVRQELRREHINLGHSNSVR